MSVDNHLDGQYPFVSVIIPVYNDPLGLNETLDSLVKQDYPINHWEIIVVDNNSISDINNIVQRYLDNDIRIKYFVEREKQSSYAARNRGIKQSRGEILAFIDADMTVNSDWISRGVSKISNRKGDYIGCRVDIYPVHQSPNIWEIYNMLTGFTIREYIENQRYSITGNLFISRELIEKVGVFDDRFFSGGDQEFGNRVTDAGFKLYYDDANKMEHPARSSMRSIWNKYYRIGKGSADLQIFYPERYGKLSFTSIIKFYRPAVKVLFGSTFKGLSPWSRLRMIFPANFVRFAYASGRLVHYLQLKTMP
jgi:glycosyltransferase involved in cell wall biosynthesis